MTAGDRHELAFLVGVVAVAAALCLLSLVALCHCLRHALLPPAEKSGGYLLTGIADDEVEMDEMRSFPLPLSGQVPRVRTPPSPSPSPVKFATPAVPEASRQRSVESLLETRLLPGRLAAPPRRGRVPETASVVAALTAHRTRSLPALPTQSFVVAEQCPLMGDVEDVEGTYVVDVNNNEQTGDVNYVNVVSREATMGANSRSASLEGALSAAMSDALTRTTVSVHTPSNPLRHDASGFRNASHADAPARMNTQEQLPANTAAQPRRRGPRKRYPRTPLPKAALNALSLNPSPRLAPAHGGSDTDRKSPYAPSDTEETLAGPDHHHQQQQQRRGSELVLVSRRALERILRRPLSASDLRDAADDATLQMSGVAPLMDATETGAASGTTVGGGGAGRSAANPDHAVAISTGVASGGGNGGDGGNSGDPAGGGGAEDEAEFMRTASPDWDHSGERQPLACTPSLTVAPDGDQWV